MIAVLSVLCSAPSWGQDVIKGKISYYGGSHQGKMTASGEKFDKNKRTAASPLKPGTKIPVYPFGTKLRVTNTTTGKSTVVIINDTGSFAKYGRKLDLSKKAFEDIAELKSGVINVKIERL